MTWSPKLFSGVVAVLLHDGCAHKALVLPLAPQSTSQPREVVDATFAFDARFVATEPTSFVALTASVDPQQAERVVRAFYAAVVARDIGRLTDLTGGTMALFHTSWHTPHSRLEHAWSRRLRRLPYDQLNGIAFIDEVRASPTYAESASALVQPGDVVVEVAFAVSRVGVDRLFADKATFVVRNIDGKPKIVDQVEDFPPP